MTALAADRQTSEKSGTLKSYPVAAVTIYKGSMVCVNSAGYLVPAADTSGYSNVLGVADEKVDNSGGSPGAKNCRVASGKAYKFAASSITQAMVGDLMYVVDDQTVDETDPGNSIRAGILVEFISATVGWVFVQHPLLASAAIGTSDLTSGAVTPAKLSTNLKKGYIPLPLTAARVVATNDVPASGTPDGGVISKNTDPVLERVNAATDKALRISWVATSVIEVILGEFAYPPDLDDTAAVIVNLLVYKDANMDASAQIAVSYFEGLGGSNVGGNLSAAITETAIAQKTCTIASGDIGAYPKTATIGLTPGAHANDAIYLVAAWIEYTRKA